MFQDQHALQLVLDNLSVPSQPDETRSARSYQLPFSNQCEVLYNLSEKGISKENIDVYYDSKKLASGVSNVTEHVRVPSSEHVAEIVGRQGCKIKALRNSTNTYIKTPGRGEEPLFIITGQKENVEYAVNQIREACNHFSTIRAQRNRSGPPPSEPGQITIRVKVPYRVVGLVVGPKGATIKNIQTETNTYIVTPSREKDPIFEITGRPDCVDKAKAHIHKYIQQRTGEINANNNIEIQQSETNRTPTGVWNPSKQEFDELNTDVNPLEHALSSVSSIYGNGGSAFDSISSRSSPFIPDVDEFKDVMNLPDAMALDLERQTNMFQRHIDEMQSSSDFGGAYSTFGWDNSSLLKPAKFSLFSDSTAEHRSPLGNRANALNRMEIGTGKISPSSVSSQHSGSSGCDLAPGSKMSGKVSPLTDLWGCPEQSNDSVTACILCHIQPVEAALVPCGHHQLCFSCANQRVDDICPTCQQSVSNALRIQK